MYQYKYWQRPMLRWIITAFATEKEDHRRFSAEYQLVMLGLALLMHGDNALQTYRDRRQR